MANQQEQIPLKNMEETKTDDKSSTGKVVTVSKLVILLALVLVIILIIIIIILAAFLGAPSAARRNKGKFTDFDFNDRCRWLRQCVARFIRPQNKRIQISLLCGLSFNISRFECKCHRFVTDRDDEKFILHEIDHRSSISNT